MSEKGGAAIMVLALFSLLWLMSSPEKIEPIPVDGLIEQVATVRSSLIVESDHIPDAGQKVSYPEIPDSSPIDHIPESTKMIDPQPSPSDRHEKAKREIIIFTRPNRPPCDQWKRCEQPRFEADGWVVAYCDQHDFGLTPHFVIEKNGKTFDHKGYLPFGKIDEVTR